MHSVRFVIEESPSSKLIRKIPNSLKLVRILSRLLSLCRTRKADKEERLSTLSLIIRGPWYESMKKLNLTRILNASTLEKCQLEDTSKLNSSMEASLCVLFHSVCILISFLFFVVFSQKKE